MMKAGAREIYQSLIVEDEPIFTEQLSQYINRVNFLAPPAICTSGIDALQIIATTPIDILFLDLALPDMTGLDLLKTGPNVRAVVVTSARYEQAVDIIDFLPKPFDFNRFLRGLNRVMQRIQPLALIPEPKPANQEKEEIYFKSGRRLERFAYSDILYMEAYGLYTKIYTFEGTFAVNKRISVLTEELPSQRFVRIHKSYIINVDHLKRLESKQLWIKATKLPIGVTYHPTVHKKMELLGISAN